MRDTVVPAGPGSTAEPTGEFEEIAWGLVLRAVGCRGVPMDSVPFDGVRGIVPNVGGRVTDGPGGEVQRGRYIVGWVKCGPPAWSARTRRVPARGSTHCCVIWRTGC